MGKESFEDLDTHKKLYVVIQYIRTKIPEDILLDLDSYLIYYCDFNYFHKYDTHLIGLNYFKRISLDKRYWTYWQVIKIEDDIIDTDESFYKFYENPSYEYLKNIEIPKRALRIIDGVVDFFKFWSLAMVRDFTQQDVPVLVTFNEEKLDYYAVHYREPMSETKCIGDFYSEDYGMYKITYKAVYKKEYDDWRIE